MDLIDEYDSTGTNKHTTRIYGANGRYAGIDRNGNVLNITSGKFGMYYCFGVKDPEEYSHGTDVNTIWYDTLQEARIIVEAYLEGKITHIPAGAETTEKYWDCECEKDFIHPKTQAVCPVCGEAAEDQPDSRINEVLLRGLPL